MEQENERFCQLQVHQQMRSPSWRVASGRITLWRKDEFQVLQHLRLRSRNVGGTLQSVLKSNTGTSTIWRKDEFPVLHHLCALGVEMLAVPFSVLKSKTGTLYCTVHLADNADLARHTTRTQDRRQTRTFGNTSIFRLPPCLIPVGNTRDTF